MDAASSVSNDSRTSTYVDRLYSRNQISFYSQIIILYILVITSIVNLTLGVDHESLWTTLLATSTGYLLPNPSLKKVTEVQRKQYKEISHSTSSGSGVISPSSDDLQSSNVV